MLISIIIPVFNVEKYLEECINSVLKQSFQDYEIILVDDGSQDKSGEMCDYYAGICEKITVIHKKNGGLSDARNVGVKAAKGEYILFLDSDDYIASESLEEVAQKAVNSRNKIDVFFLEAVKFYPDGREEPLGDGYEKRLIEGQSKNTVMQHLAYLPKFPGSACSKMVSRELIERHNLYFQEGLLSEDIEWTVRLLKAAQTFGYTETPFYYYRQQREGSITNTFGIKNIESLLYIVEKFSSHSLLENSFQNSINSFMAYEFVIILYHYALLDKKERRMVKESLRRNRWILRYGLSRKTKIINLAVSVFGMSVTSYLLKIYKNRK